MKANQTKQTMKNKTNKTVLEYIKKNPVMICSRFEKYIRSKKGISLESDQIKRNCFRETVIFFDGSYMTIGFCLWINDDDRMVIIFKFVITENEEWNNETKYTEQDLNNVY